MPSFCSSICANTSPIFEACFASLTSRNLPWRYNATSRALRSFSTARNSSPAFGEPCRPSTWTGMDGAALSTGLPFSSNMARTRPNSLPAMIGSPSFSVPFFTRTVATAPRPFSTDDSMTMPVARPSAAAVSSSTSAWSRMASNNASTPWPVFADTCTNMFEPPHSSAMTSCLESSVRTRSGSASGLSILFTATTIGTPAALACWIASMVCGMTPSSAATTSTTTSVALAPRARMAVNAAWPGVSRNVTMPFAVSTWYAPMC